MRERKCAAGVNITPLEVKILLNFSGSRTTWIAYQEWQRTTGISPWVSTCVLADRWLSISQLK